jgi:citrate lyase subunit beta/citryl-CoA lyase
MLWSRRIIAAHAEAIAAGNGLVLVDDRLVENLHVQNANRIISLADAIASLDHGSGS